MPLKQRYDSEVTLASQLGISTLSDTRFQLRFLKKPNIRETTIKKMVSTSRSSAIHSIQSAWAYAGFLLGGC